MSSVRDRIRAVPRTVVGVGLSAARVPVNLAARATGQTENEAWAPSVAFEGLEAGVESVLGSLLRDETLVERGRIRQAKVAQVRKAVELETLAAQERQQADDRFTEQRRRADQRRADAEKQAEKQEQQAEKQAAARKRAAEQKAATKATAAKRVKAAQDSSLDEAERRARLEALSAESDALGAEKQALDAAETVEVIDDSIEGKKAARATG